MVQRKIKIISVVGARPNFMKVAPIHKAFIKLAPHIIHQICHTGQHFDEKMSKVFFDDLDLPKPDFFLGVSGGSHAQQTASIIYKFEQIVLDQKPDAIIVVGDVNSTMACAIVASKLRIKLIHVEAGLRSFDNEMPEEINRKITDVISDMLFVSEPSGMENLTNESIAAEKMFFVGNVMIDSLQHYLPQAKTSQILSALAINPQQYFLITFHRPSNVDTLQSLTDLVDFLNTLSTKRTVVFPIHPRTKNNLVQNDLLKALDSRIILTEPIGYINFIALQMNALLVITDSGGIQEETTALGVQCITVRDTTERPVTISMGTNQLIGTDFGKVIAAASSIIAGNIKKGTVPALWDGKAAERIVSIIQESI